MAQQSMRRDRENQFWTTCAKPVDLIRTRSTNSHTGPRHLTAATEAGQMTGIDYAARTFSRFLLRSRGRPQMSNGSLDDFWMARMTCKAKSMGKRPAYRWVGQVQPGPLDPACAAKCATGYCTIASALRCRLLQRPARLRLCRPRSDAPYSDFM